MPNRISNRTAYRRASFFDTAQYAFLGFAIAGAGTTGFAIQQGDVLPALAFGLVTIIAFAAAFACHNESVKPIPGDGRILPMDTKTPTMRKRTRPTVEARERAPAE